MDRLLEDFFGNAPNMLQRAGVPVRAFPALNVWEEGDNFYVEAELPGVRHEDLDIQVVGNTLTLKGQRGGSAPEGVAYHRQERGTGEFVRVVRVPSEVNADKVEAELKDGVLRLTLPKAEVAKPRKIQVGMG
jgi:HSP20 family protein